MTDDLARYYHILGLEPNAPPEEVKIAYRDCVDAWHPDRFTHSPERQARAQARLKQINEAYKQLRRHASAHRSTTSTRTNPPPSEPKRPSAQGTAAGTGEPRQQEPRTRAHGATDQQSRTQATEPSPEAPSTRTWLELSRESRFTVTTLYFSFVTLIISAGCGISLGGMYFGPLGAICGILVSPLVGLTVAAASAAVSAVIAGRLGGLRGNLIGGALALLVPGSVCGAVLVWSTSRAILGDTLPPMLDILLGGTVGAGCGLGLGAWTGKAISIAMGEFQEP